MQPIAVYPKRGTFKSIHTYWKAYGTFSGIASNFTEISITKRISYQTNVKDEEKVLTFEYQAWKSPNWHEKHQMQR